MDATTKAYRRKVWRTIRGQVECAAKAHPAYFSKPYTRQFIDSVAKRVYGQVMTEQFQKLLTEAAATGAAAQAQKEGNCSPAQRRGRSMALFSLAAFVRERFKAA